MTNEVWIFGDSFAQEHPECEHSWPMLLKKEYTVKNVAMGGSGPDYQISLLLNEIKKYDTTNVDIIFFVSETSRFNFNFLKTPRHQYLIKHLSTDSTLFTKDTTTYRKYKKFIKAFFQNYVLHSTYNDTEIVKIILLLRELGSKFNNMLIVSTFDDLDNCLINIDNTKNVHIVKNKFKDVETDRYMSSANHLSKEVHKHVYEKITYWLSTKEKIIFKNKLDKINN